MIDSEDSSSYSYVSGHGSGMQLKNQYMHISLEGNRENMKKKSYDMEAMRKIRENLAKRDNQGRTYLHYAAFSGDLKKAQQLCSLGFSADVTDMNLNTPLHVASEYGHNSLISYLVQQRANINRQNVQGKTALHLSVEKGFLQTAQLLLYMGANPNIPDLQGAGPLHYSAANNTLEISKSLLQCGAFVNARDYAKETPLFYAIRESSLASVDLLVNNYYADVNIANEDQETALSFAKDLSENDIVMILQGHTSQPVSAILPSSSFPLKSSQPMQLPLQQKPTEQQVIFDRPQSL